MNYSSSYSRRFLCVLLSALALGACAPPSGPVPEPARMPEVEEAARREVALAWARERGGAVPVVRRAEVLAVETLEDARPVRLSQALVWVELDQAGRTGYALANLVRGTHPPEWQGRTSADGPYLGARFFDRAVREADVCALLAEPYGWTRPTAEPGGFRIVERQAPADAWRRALGTAAVASCLASG